METITRIKSALADGLVLGVKWAVVLVVVGFVLAMLSGDYLITRQRSINGQAAFDYIDKLVKAQKPQSPLPDVK